MCKAGKARLLHHIVTSRAGQGVCPKWRSTSCTKLCSKAAQQLQAGQPWGSVPCTSLAFIEVCVAVCVSEEAAGMHAQA